MRAIRLPLAIASLVTIPLILSLGCGSRGVPTAPDNGAPGVQSLPGSGAFLSSFDRASGLYPLQSGNHWDYARTFTVEVHPYTGPVVYEDPYSSTIATDQTCEETTNGHTYLIERQVATTPNGVFYGWIRVRQDRTGLYEADLSIFSRPECEGGPEPPPPPDRRETAILRLAAAMPAAERSAWTAALERDADLRGKVYAALGLGDVHGTPRVVSPPYGELLRLSYPLHPGAEWTVRTDPVFTQRVEGVDALRTPAGTLVGYRIHILSELLGDHDRAFVWYGPQGFLQFTGHFESIATDENGNPYGIVVSDDRQILTGLSLEGGPTQTAGPRKI